ncbi:Protein kinase domain [Trypanosoma conorhini]|uniref:dual-specificity kinase n=1 Tax=Trypanosoma conorhini TaxID=83891 RepID=A0A422PUE3_9TRYP|nr:Protein kinase domain [Trypanosoma conorhini]RNF21356.1 Protein kinase domain [Trypanosoma conorhini]
MENSAGPKAPCSPARAARRLTPSPEALICGRGDANTASCNTAKPNSAAASTAPPPVRCVLPGSTRASACILESSPRAEETSNEKRPVAAASPTWGASIHEGQRPPAEGEARGAKAQASTSTPTRRLGGNLRGSRRCMLWARRRSELPITPAEALACCGAHLSAYEKREIFGFPRVYYCGAHAHGAAPVAGAATPARQRSAPPDFDDCENNYRITPGDHVGYRFELLDVLGSGTYGVVVRALDHATRPTPQQCALKIARSTPCYAAVLRREAAMLELLWRRKPAARMWIPQVLGRLLFRAHEVLVLPLLGLDVKTLLRVNLFRPLPTALTQAVTAQLVTLLQLLAEVNMTHADLKLENVALVDRSPHDAAVPPELRWRMSPEEQARDAVDADGDQGRGDASVPDSVQAASSPQSRTAHGAAPAAEAETDTDADVVTSHVALIDFGAAHLGRACGGRLQTIFYRAPEVALRLRHGPAIDMWSLGCVVYETATGVPLFRANSDGELLRRQVAVLGAPSAEAVRQLQALRTSSSSSSAEEEETGAGQLQALFASLQVEAARDAQRCPAQAHNLLQLLHFQKKKDATTPGRPQEKAEEKPDDADNAGFGPPVVPASITACENDGGAATLVVPLLLDFLLGCLTWDPGKRLTPGEASCHPYLAPYLKSELAQADARPPPPRCTGEHFLRTHQLARGAVGLFDAAAKTCAHSRSATGAWTAGTQSLTRLDVSLAVQPLCRFTAPANVGAASETPLRVSARPLRPHRRAAGDEGEGPQQQYTANFCDPIEHVQVSILSLEEY